VELMSEKTGPTGPLAKDRDVGTWHNTCAENGFWLLGALAQIHSLSPSEEDGSELHWFMSGGRI
jgi:hypothetical protein